MPWFLYLALKQLFPTGRRFPFLTAISVLGVTLGVGLLVVVTSVMSGFRQEIYHMIVDTQGEIQIKSGQPIPDYTSVIKRIETVPVVAAATPYAKGVVMVQFHNKPAFPILVGLDLASAGKVANLNSYIYGGSLDDLDDDSVILDAGLAENLGATVGDTVEITSPLFLNKLGNDEVFMARQFRVAGLLHIGHVALDVSSVYGTLRLVQDLYGLGSNVHGINVRLKPGVDEAEAVAKIDAVLPPGIRAFTWEESYSDFLWAVNLEKGMMFFLLLFIVIVAAFSVTSSLFISVVRKTREIGLLGALGARPLHVALCFCSQGFFIGLFGTILGIALGCGLLSIRNQVVLGIARVLGREQVLSEFYHVNALPAYTEPADIARIVVLTVLLSLLAGLLPAIRAARLKPVEAFRNE